MSMAPVARTRLDLSLKSGRYYISGSAPLDAWKGGQYLARPRLALGSPEQQAKRVGHPDRWHPGATFEGISGHWLGLNDQVPFLTPFLEKLVPLFKPLKSGGPSLFSGCSLASPPTRKWNWGRGVTPGDLHLWFHFPCGEG